jgi:hypothetical protein
MNFHTEEWAFLRDKINEGIALQMRALETAGNIEQVFKAQGALAALKNLAKLPEKAKTTA